MNIDEMPAGREMDLTITEFMGWPISKDFRKDLALNGWQKWPKWIDWLRNPANYPYVEDVGNRLIIFRLPNQNGRTWSPSTDYAAAMEVAEYLLHRTRLLQFRAEVVSVWKYAKFVDCGNDSTPVYGACSVYMPLAICRAALKAVKDQ